MRDNIYYRWFIKSLREDQLKDYNSYSTNEQNNWYISYLESHYSGKWTCTDPSCNQYRFDISETVFKFHEDRIKNPETKEKYMYESEIDLADYTRDEILNHCTAFYTTKEINKWIDDQSNNALLAECIFEMED